MTVVHIHPAKRVSTLDILPFRGRHQLGSLLSLGPLPSPPPSSSLGSFSSSDQVSPSPRRPCHLFRRDQSVCPFDLMRLACVQALVQLRSPQQLKGGPCPLPLSRPGNGLHHVRAKEERAVTASRASSATAIRGLRGGAPMDAPPTIHVIAVGIVCGEGGRFPTSTSSLSSYV